MANKKLPTVKAKKAEVTAGKMMRGSCKIDWKKYEKYVRQHGRKRGKNMPWKDADNEIDFMMGAHVIMGFCDEMDKLPSDVVFGYMRGNNPSLLGLKGQYKFYEKEEKDD